METDLELNEKRIEVKNEITEGINKTPMASLFGSIGRIVQKITRYPKPLPLIYSAAILAPMILIPWLLFGLLFSGGNKALIRLGVFPTIIVLEVAFLSVILTYLNINKVLSGIRDTLVNSIVSSKDLSNLQQWLSFGWTSRINRYFLFYWIFWSCSALLLCFNSFWGFLGSDLMLFSLFSLYFVFFGGISFYYAPLMLLLPLRLRNYQFALYENDPSRSEVVDVISGILNYFVYGYVLIILMLQLAFPMIHLPILGELIILVVIGWVPVTLQYVINQISIRNIISLSKRKTLNHIQTQIKEFHDGDITNKENIETINRLMDYHERIRVTPNSGFNIESSLRFLNQLIIPFLGFLLGNIDKVIDYFR